MAPESWNLRSHHPKHKHMARLEYKLKHVDPQETDLANAGGKGIDWCSCAGLYMTQKQDKDHRGRQTR